MPAPSPASNQKLPRPVMIVEDDLDIRDALAQVLEDEGYAVTLAANGADALALMRKGASPSLILLDLMMPVMNGWQFRTEQQRDPTLAAIPVLVISADGNVREKAAAIGAAGFIRKPIHVDDLLDAVRRFVGPS